MVRKVIVGCMALVGGVAVAQSGTKVAEVLRPRIELRTTQGDVVIELDAERTPLTAINFVQYVEDGFYDGLIFHRVAEGRLIQGGRYTQNFSPRTDGLHDPVAYEGAADLKNVRGTIAAFRELGNADSAQAEFFINATDNPALDTNQHGPGYVVMGRVVDGMDVVDRIAATPTTTHKNFAAGRLAQVPADPVVIKSARLLTKFDRAAVEAHLDELKRRAESERIDAENAAIRDLQAQEERIAREAGAPLTVTDSGLKYADKRVGTGQSPTPGDRVEVHFKGMLPDGTVLNNSWNEGDGLPVPRKLSALIKGMQEGLQTMQEGGYRLMIVPPELAFGEQGIPQKIPPHATLIIEMELYRVLPP